MDNVIILAPPRSGSSMITKVFLAHGLFLNTKAEANQFGYRTYEHLPLRREINAITHMVGPMEKRFKSGFSVKNLRRLFRVHNGKTPWCFKAGPQYFDILYPAFPEARYVLVMRNIESMIQSQQAKSKSRDARLWIERFSDAITGLHVLHGFPIVQSDKVIEGDYSTLQAAFDHYNMDFDPAIAGRCIDKTMWRF